MDVKHEDLSLCNACLCVGRKLHQITEEKAIHFYLNALSEIPLFDTSTPAPSVCWECKLLLHRAVQFREQVKDSYRILVTYTNVNLHSCLISDVARPPRLKIIINDNINIEPTYTYELFDDDVKGKADFDELNTKNSFKKSEDIRTQSTQKVFVKEECEIKYEDDENDAIYSDEQENNFVSIDNLGIDNEIKDILKEDKKIRKAKKKHNGDKVRGKKVKKLKGKTKEEIPEIIDLSLEEMTIEREREYQKESYVNAEFKCENCIIGFNYDKSFKTHLTSKHSTDIGDYTCPICKTVLVSVDSFTTHYKRHMRRYECSICQKRTMDLKVMQQHYYTTHEISLKKYTCNECGKISKSIDSHRYHTDSHKSRLQCNQCDKTFRHRGGLLNHKLTVHELRNDFPCNLCSKVFRWKNSLKRHLDTHGDKCNQCDKTFRHRGGLLNHKLTVHELRNDFPCNLCSKVFRWKNSLKRHLDTHGDKNKLSSNAAFCIMCNISFASISSYQRHMNNSLKHVTKDDFRFICDHCNRRFANKTKLRDHIEEKHLHKTYQCEICFKVSKNRVNLDQHIRNVHKGRPNNKICHHCGKGFPTKVQLESHIRTHTGERPFICEFCPTTFSQQSNLYKHNRQVHLNMKSKRYPLSKKVKEDIPIQNERSNLPMEYNPIEIAFNM